ncbi:MAG: hypothetical protein LBG59_08890 [Candidatus Peribacteria bacterium]|nr:hypothetical protein [Candidatus Peribacteria bacterium]
MMKNIVNEIKQYYYNQIYYHLPEDTHKKKLIYPCNYLTVNSGIALIDKNLFIPIQTFQFQTFQFLGYYDKKNDICFYKDEKYVYGNDLVFFSGFDYESLQILTGMIFDVEGNVYEKSCP